MTLLSITTYLSLLPKSHRILHSLFPFLLFFVYQYADGSTLDKAAAGGGRGGSTTQGEETPFSRRFRHAARGGGGGKDKVGVTIVSSMDQQPKLGVNFDAGVVRTRY
jgi:hypothetical protein